MLFIDSHVSILRINNILRVVIVLQCTGRSLIIFMSSDYWVLMIYEDEGRSLCHPPWYTTLWHATWQILITNQTLRNRQRRFCFSLSLRLPFNNLLKIYCMSFSGRIEWDQECYLLLLASPCRWWMQSISRRYCLSVTRIRNTRGAWMSLKCLLHRLLCFI